MLILDKLGLLEPYAPAGVDRILPEFKDKNSNPTWVGIDLWETAIVVNTEELKKRNLPIPTSYEDLIKPEYKGLIVSCNPNSSGTGFLTVSGILQLYGEQKGWEYLDKLDKNMAQYVHSGSQPAKMAAAGEYPIGVSYDFAGFNQKKKARLLKLFFLPRVPDGRLRLMP